MQSGIDTNPNADPVTSLDDVRQIVCEEAFQMFIGEVDVKKNKYLSLFCFID